MQRDWNCDSKYQNCAYEVDRCNPIGCVLEGMTTTIQPALSRIGLVFGGLGVLFFLDSFWLGTYFNWSFFTVPVSSSSSPSIQIPARFWTEDPVFALTYFFILNIHYSLFPPVIPLELKTFRLVSEFFNHDLNSITCFSAWVWLHLMLITILS